MPKISTANFVREFIKYPSKVGTLTQSSRFLARAIARQINGSSHVVEFGPGMGAVTTEILKRLPAQGQLTCFEINPRFCRHLSRIDDARLKIINDDARNCEKYVHNLDCIISSLPLVLLNKSAREEIFAISRRSKRFIQLQYSPVLAETVKTYFSDVKVKFAPLNFPPAFVYVCTSPEPRVSGKIRPLY